jgi:predicted membrane-bound mannosyltransferase
MWRYFSQVDLPTPDPGELGHRIFGPLQGILSMLWWAALLLAGAVLVFGFIRYVGSAVAGNAKGMSKGRTAIFAPVAAIVMVVVARIVATWALTAWG